MKYIPSIVCLLIVVITWQGRANGDTTIFVVEDDFLSAVGDATLESFEGLPLGTPAGDSLQTPFFTVTRLASPGGDDLVRNDSGNGGPHATDGEQYLGLGHSNAVGGTLIFDFFSPISYFGLSITDFGDHGSGILSFSTNAGNSFTIANTSTLPSNENELFFGIVNDGDFFTRVELTSSTIGDGIGFDEVYFTPIPEPSALTLAIGALLGFVSRRTRPAVSR